ncbi:integrase catalytic domain-containing protein [Trichonephila clavipes]|nr:integrase catalytic domain-containing protein [Trichonephila clavipes]
MQPKAKHSLRAQAQLMRTETVKTLRLKRERKASREKTERLEISQTPAKRCQFEQFICSRTIVQLYYLRRGEISEINVFLQLLDTSYVRATRELEKKRRYCGECTDTIAKLKTKIENSSTFESDPDFVKTLIQNCIDERVSRNEREVTLEKQKIELAKLQLAKLEKEIELQTAKNKALSLNPAAKVEEKQFETNIENMIKSIRSLSLPVPTRSENFNLFFQSIERAFLTKKINDEYKSEILINLLGERAHNVLLRDIHPICCKIDGKLPILLFVKKSYNSFESLCDLIISDKLFETLNKETATHIGIREAEDWFRPIDLAKECDIYISSRSGSHKEIPITYGYTQDPFKNRSQNFKTKIKENYPQYLERENKNCFICGDSSHCARDCEKRFKPKESNDHIHNRINVNTLKVESEKQNSDGFEQFQYVNIFVENQPVTTLIDSGCQIPVLNSSLIRVHKPSEEIITLSSCFGEQRMVEVKPINLSLNQHFPGLSVRTAISPTLTEEFIIHPSVYSEIKKLGHAKSDVLLNESESSLGAYAYPSAVSFSNVIENSSYDLPHVKNFNTRNDSSSLIKDYKCNKIKSTKLKLSIVREKCSDTVLCKKVSGAMKTSSVEFISRSPTPSPMESKHRRFVLLRRIFEPWQWKRRKKRNRFEQTSRTLERKISMRSTKDQLVKKDVLMPDGSDEDQDSGINDSVHPSVLSSSQNHAMPVKNNVFLWNLPDVEEVPSHDGETV